MEPSSPDLPAGNHARPHLSLVTSSVLLSFPSVRSCCPPPPSYLLFITGSTLPYPSLTFSPPPVKVCPSNPSMRAGGTVRSPSGVRGGAPAEIEFGAF